LRTARCGAAKKLSLGGLGEVREGMLGPAKQVAKPGPGYGAPAKKRDSGHGPGGQQGAPGIGGGRAGLRAAMYWRA